MTEELQPIHLTRTITINPGFDEFATTFDTVQECGALAALTLQEVLAALVKAPLTEHTFYPNRTTCNECLDRYRAYTQS